MEKKHPELLEKITKEVAPLFRNKIKKKTKREIAKQISTIKTEISSAKDFCYNYKKHFNEEEQFNQFIDKNIKALNQLERRTERKLKQIAWFHYTIEEFKETVKHPKLYFSGHFLTEKA